ncbi:MAG: hypothetical protein H7259_03135 [Cytophagales bacterium]|nr:hypothetical protein [Cytophaga sp.]
MVEDIIVFILYFLIPVRNESFQETYYYRTVKEPLEEVRPYQEPARKASYAGGDPAFIKYIIDSIPEASMDYPGNEITIWISFTIEKDGSLSGVEIITPSASKPPSPAFAKEIKRIATTAPKWVPAYANGTPVSERKIIPVKLRKTKEE